MSHKVFYPFVILLFVLSLSFVPASAVSATVAQAATSNLIVNGDFESGNTGFISEYTFSPGNITAAAVYDVLTNPVSSHPSAFAFGDHTSGAGLMMAINGADSGNPVVWSQSVAVTANTNYEFSAWITSWFPESPAQLQFRINGNQVGTFTALSTAGVWQQFATTWNSGTSTMAMIEIIDLNTANNGNDFALDDITLRSFVCNTPTATPTGTPPTSTPTGTLTNTPTNTPVGGPTNTPTTTQTPTNTPIGGPTNTPTNLPVSDLGLLKLCESAGNGIAQGQIFTITAGNINYSVPAGYCVLAGQFPPNTQVTVQQNIPSGYYVATIEVKPSARMVSRDSSTGVAIVRMGTGVTEVVFTNGVVGTPTATPTPVTVTSTPRPTRTPTATPSCAPNCTPTPTPVPTGRFQICKEADGAGVNGYFTFRFNTRYKIIPVGACSLVSSAKAGTLTITEDARAGYAVSDIYTIPADRLVNKNINNRTVTVTIVPGNASTQTIIVFVNRAVTAQVIADVVSSAPQTDVRLSDNPLRIFMQALRNGVSAWWEPAHSTG